MDFIKCNASSIKGCKVLKKLVGVLSFYGLMKKEVEKDKELLGSYLKESGLSVLSLLDLLGHVMREHVDCKDRKEERDSEFELLCSLVSAKMGAVCDLGLCSVFSRHNRIRSADLESDNLLLFNLLDSVHVLFLHSYDSGYRMSGYGGDEDECSNVEDVVDLKFLEMKQKVKEIRERVQTRISSGKFNTEVDEEKEEKNDEEKEEKKQEEKQLEKVEYSFGKRFYYWEYYKNNKQQDYHYNKGQTYKDCYVEKKFQNIKEEVTLNKMKSLSKLCYPCKLFCCLNTFALLKIQ